MADVINMRQAGAPNVSKIVRYSVIGLIALVILINAFTTVKAGHSGVVTTFGKVNDVVLTEGLHFKIPFVQQIVQIDNRVLKAEVQCTSASKDLQIVSSTIALNYKVTNLSSGDIYKNVGTDFENKIVTPAIQESVKAITAKFTAEDLIANRQIVGEQMKENLASKIESFGLQLQIFNIIDFQFSAEFNAAIEAKQTAQQNALKAEQDLARIKVEAQQKVEQAKAEAEAYKLKSLEITDSMILMEYINKWDGKLPMVSSEGTMMLDISKMAEDFNSTNTTTTTTP